MARQAVIRIPRIEVKRKTPVMWVIPVDELCYSRWAMYMTCVPRHPDDEFRYQIDTYLPFARNDLHHEFLDSDYKWLFMLDSDVVPPPNIIEALMGRGQKVVSGWYKTKAASNYPAVFDQELNQDGTPKLDEWGNPTWAARAQPGVGLEKVGAVGVGCMLMHKDVAIALGEKPYNENEGGEDLTLCRKINELGFGVWVDWDMKCSHVGTAVY